MNLFSEMSRLRLCLRLITNAEAFCYQQSNLEHQITEEKKF